MLIIIAAIERAAKMARIQDKLGHVLSRIGYTSVMTKPKYIIYKRDGYRNVYIGNAGSIRCGINHTTCTPIAGKIKLSMIEAWEFHHRVGIWPNRDMENILLYFNSKKAS